jgi:hypothetical protein
MTPINPDGDALDQLAAENRRLEAENRAHREAEEAAQRKRHLAVLQRRHPDALRPVYDEQGNRVGYERLRVPGR